MNNNYIVPNIEEIRSKLRKLHMALGRGRSRGYCLRLWSDFIRERDANRCVDCHSSNNLSAHHICRKSFMDGAQFLTGNGITLCRECHGEVHNGFNGRPDLTLPVDAQNGEKLALMERLFCILTDDAVEQGLMKEEFYFLSDEILGSFKKMQGYRTETKFPGSRIEQAYLILAECELGLRSAMMKANGISVLDKPLLPGGLLISLVGENGQPDELKIIQTYTPRSKAD